MKLQRVQNCSARVVTRCPRFYHSLVSHYHSLNHCIGSLSDIALFVRYVHLPIKHFHPRNHHSYIHCSLLLDSPDGFDDHLMSELELFLVDALTLWNSLPVSVTSVGNIATFRRKLKTYLFKLIILSSTANQSNCLQLELLNNKLFNPFYFGTLPSLGLQRILSQ